MLNFTKIADFKLPELPYRYVNGKEDYSLINIKEGNLQKLKNIKLKYGNYIKKWASVFELGEPVLTSFIAVESSGIMLGRNKSGAIGLTQVSVTALIEGVSRFKNATGQNLPKEAVDLIKQKAPYLLNLSTYEQNLSIANISKLESLLIEDANFNIMAGALVLRWNFEFTKFKALGYTQKAIIAYNQSAYGRIRAYKDKYVTTLTLFKDTVIPKETRDYLAKLLGKNGLLELYASNDL